LGSQSKSKTANRPQGRDAKLWVHQLSVDRQAAEIATDVEAVVHGIIGSGAIFSAPDRGVTRRLFFADLLPRKTG